MHLQNTNAVIVQFLPVSNKLNNEKVLLPLFMQALRKAVEPIRVITQTSVSYLTWFCKSHFKCKAMQNQATSTSKLLITKTPKDTQKAMYTTLE